MKKARKNSQPNKNEIKWNVSESSKWESRQKRSNTCIIGIHEAEKENNEILKL